MKRPAPRHRCVRRSYDAVAEEYAAGFRNELAGKPLDRALLACLAEQADDGAPIADLGCGPGHVAAWLAGHGVEYGRHRSVAWHDRRWPEGIPGGGVPRGGPA